jgi:flagellar biosynthesis GTPase FlhF
MTERGPEFQPHFQPQFQPQQSPSQQQPPKKKHTGCKVAGIALGAVIVIVGVVAALSEGSDSVAPQVTATSAPAKVPGSQTDSNEYDSTKTEKPKTAQSEAPAKAKPAERKPAKEQPAEEAPAEEAPAEEAPAEPDYSVEQEQAIAKAQSYLEFTAFSKKGLVKQLEYEQFSTSDAKFAVNYIDVDWKEQAVLKAESYLEFTSFSEAGLVDQLLYEGFTRAQAEHGAAEAFNE